MQDVQGPAGQGAQVQLLLFAEDQDAALAVVAKSVRIDTQDLSVAASDEAFRSEIMKPGEGLVNRDITQFAVLDIRRQVKRGNLVAD